MYGYPKSEYGRSNYRLGLDTFCDVIVLVTVLWLLLKTILAFTDQKLLKLSKWFQKVFQVDIPGYASYVIVFLNLMALIANIFMFLNVRYLDWLRSSGDLLATTKILKAFHAVELGLSVIAVALLVVDSFWPYAMLADCLIVVCSVLQVVITFATVLVNFSAVYISSSEANYLHQEKTVVCMSLFLGFTAFLGLATVIVVRSKNRLSVQSHLLVKFYMTLAVISAILCLCWLVYSLCELARLQESIAKDVTIVNPILAAAGFLIDVCCIWCCYSIGSTPKTKLKVQVYDLSQLTSGELELLAKVIDNSISSRESPDRTNGANALDLMMAYVNSPMSNFSCKVLRVYDDSNKINKYDQKKAWDGYDFENYFAETEAKSESTLLETETPAPLSKNALKRLRKKNQKASIQEKTGEVSEELTEFKRILASTEAIVLLTCIHKYDLTSTLKGRFGALLASTVGSKSWLKLSCVRLGILGTHWPFRQMIFYTATTKKPSARQAAVLSAISTWNNRLERSERCTLLYNPVYETPTNEAALKLGGWITTRLIPSHVIDLRASFGKTLEDYLKSIKYRNRAGAFNKAGGEVLPISHFSKTNCEKAMELWENVANKRVSDGNTAVLQAPNTEFLTSLGGQLNNTSSLRKLLFLRVNGEVIASCVLFNLGNTLTSDIQGLDHEKARQYNAYFVMMQETIRIALAEKISFVDFGPTTAKPKMDIGCTQIPLIGGIYCKQPLAACVGMFAKNVNG